MIGIRSGVTAAMALVTIASAVSAQGPVRARHVRAAPIKVARVVTNPVLDAVGSFAPLPESGLVQIIGIVQDTAGILAPNAGTVIVRDLRSGAVVGTTAVNALAQFSLRSIPPGLYAAELVDPSGTVMTTTPAFLAHAGEIIELAPTIPVRPSSGLARVLRSATSAALTTAASTGVLALTPGASVTPGS